MRLLVVTHNYPRFPGDPAGAFVARIAQGAARAGFEVRVVAPHAPGTSVRETDQGLQLHRFRYAPEALERVAYTGDLHRGALWSPLAALAFPAFLLAFRRAITTEIRDFAPEIIHAHWWLPGGWLVSGRGTPYIVTCHGSDVRLLERSALFRRMARPVFRRAGRVTTVSRFLAADIGQLLKGDSGNLVPLPMPVDVAHFRQGLAVPKTTPPLILYAGNLVPSKGVDALIRAYALLRGRGLTCSLRILGEGPERQALERLARDLGAPDVSWSDFVPQGEMPAEYGRSTITVLPTRGDAEGLGLTLVEALLAGSAVAGTRAGGIPEIIEDGVTGLLMPYEPEGMAESLGRLLADPPLRQRLTDAGRGRVESVFATEPATARFLQLYRDVAQHHSGN
ncbi:MAG: glycosyltransferase [Gemmatimonadota bacterium]